MKAKKFELFMCCLGNGITVCNKAVEENGDYKFIAHISEKGNIKWYVSDGYCPAIDKKRIEDSAKRQREAFMKVWNCLPDTRKYEKMLDELPLNVSLPYMGKSAKPLCERIAGLEEEYFKY